MVMNLMFVLKGMFLMAGNFLTKMSVFFPKGLLA